MSSFDIFNASVSPGDAIAIVTPQSRDIQVAYVARLTPTGVKAIWIDSYNSSLSRGEKCFRESYFANGTFILQPNCNTQSKPYGYGKYTFTLDEIATDLLKD